MDVDDETDGGGGDNCGNMGRDELRDMAGKPWPSFPVGLIAVIVDPRLRSGVADKKDWEDDTVELLERVE